MYECIELKCKWIWKFSGKKLNEKWLTCSRFFSRFFFFKYYYYCYYHFALALISFKIVCTYICMFLLVAAGAISCFLSLTFSFGSAFLYKSKMCLRVCTYMVSVCVRACVHFVNMISFALLIAVAVLVWKFYTYTGTLHVWFALRLFSPLATLYTSTAGRPNQTHMCK